MRQFLTWKSGLPRLRLARAVFAAGHRIWTKTWRATFFVFVAMVRDVRRWSGSSRRSRPRPQQQRARRRHAYLRRLRGDDDGRPDARRPGALGRDRCAIECLSAGRSEVRASQPERLQRGGALPERKLRIDGGVGFLVDQHDVHAAIVTQYAIGTE